MNIISSIIYFQAILLLEILWPVLIFVLVGLLRTGIPPKSKETCKYLMSELGLRPLRHYLGTLNRFHESFVPAFLVLSKIKNVT